MSAIAFTKVESLVFTFGGCGLHNVMCMGNGEMLTVLEEIGGPEPSFAYPQRPFRSTDNGLTWTELDPYMSTHNLWRHKGVAMGAGIVLVGNEGPDQCGPPSGDDVIARTTDRGDTWMSVVPSGEYTSWVTEGFVVIAGDTVWALGVFAHGTEPCDDSLGEFHILKSTDAGASFADPETLAPTTGTILFASCGVALSASIFLIGYTGGVGAGNPSSLMRTTDGGASWAQIQMPSGASGFGGVLSLADMGGGVVLATGRTNKLWRSTDSGATWSDITGSIPDGGAPGELYRLGDNRAVLAVFGAPNTIVSPWRFTEDGGATWQTATGTGFTDGAASHLVRAFAVAEDGAILAAIGVTGSEPQEIWRGVVTGFTPESPCGDFEAPPEAGELGRPAVCQHGFIAALCPQTCAVDPSLGAVYAAPTVSAYGFLSPLFVLGLAFGHQGALAKPAVCGHGFAHDNCGADVCAADPELEEVEA